MIRGLLPDLLILLGAALIPAGTAMFSLPIALVVAGLELIYLGGRLAKR